MYPLVDIYINSSLQTPGNSSAGFCFQFAAESGTWLSLPNRFIHLFHFLDTLHSASQHIFNGKVHLYKISILVIILKNKIKVPTQTFSETK